MSRAAAERRVPLRNVWRPSQSRERRRSASRRTNSMRLEFFANEVPVQPCELVVLAIGVVVAALVWPNSSPARASARPATGTASRAGFASAGAQCATPGSGRALDAAVPAEVVGVAVAVLEVGRVVALVVGDQSFSVKPSWAVTKLTLAVGLRPSRGTGRSSRRTARRSAEHGRSPRQNARMVSR